MVWIALILGFKYYLWHDRERRVDITDWQMTSIYRGGKWNDGCHLGVGNFYFMQCFLFPNGLHKKLSRGRRLKNDRWLWRKRLIRNCTVSLWWHPEASDFPTLRADINNNRLKTPNALINSEIIRHVKRIFRFERVRKNNKFIHRVPF